MKNTEFFNNKLTDLIEDAKEQKLMAIALSTVPTDDSFKTYNLIHWSGNHLNSSFAHIVLQMAILYDVPLSELIEDLKQNG